MSFTFNQTPGSGNANNIPVPEMQQLILVELRIISTILAQMNPGIIHPDDLDNLRADPSLIQQRLS